MGSLLKLLFFTLFAGWLSSVNGYQCPSRVPRNCLCNTHGYRFLHYFCVIHGQKSVSTSTLDLDADSKYAYFSCGGHESDLNEIIPARHLCRYIKFTKMSLSCPLNENVTVQNYFDRLDVSEVTELDLTLKKNTFKKEIFAGTSNIIKLNFHFNYFYNFTSLPSDMFEYLTDLESIVLTLHATSLPEKLFSKNKKLRRFELFERFGSVQLPAGLLSNLPNLEFVSVRNVDILSVTFDLFVDSRNIKFISLKWNALATIPEDLFSSQICLEELDLSKNNLSVIPANLFKNTVELKILHLGNNAIASLPATLFENSKKLRKIDLSFNKIGSIPDNLLSSLDQLEELLLERNQIRRLSSDMLPANIKSLNLSKNRLEVIDRNFLIRFKNNLYNEFSFHNNPIKCECNDDFLALDAVSSKIPFFSFYPCVNETGKLIADAVGECKLHARRDKISECIIVADDNIVSGGNNIVAVTIILFSALILSSWKQ